MLFSIERKGLKLKLDLGNLDFSNKFITDENRLMQIMLNLLSNASKFTLKGSIQINVDVIFHEDDNAKSIKITVKDTGIGI